MTSLISVAAPNPFRLRHEQIPLLLRKPAEPFSFFPIGFEEPLEAFLPERNISSNSDGSIWPTAAARNNENTSPFFKRPNWASTTFSKPAWFGRNEKQNPTSQNAEEMGYQQISSQESLIEGIPGRDLTTNSPNYSPSRPASRFAVVPQHRFRNDTPRFISARPAVNSRVTNSNIRHHRDAKVKRKTDNIEPFPDFVDNSYPKCQITTESASENRFESSPANRSAGVVPYAVHPLGHQHRSSDSSSAYVQTMKTATISNASLSIAPRSIIIGRSDESHSGMQDVLRTSMENEPLIAKVLPNDGAIQRGLKRQQIINELIMTEESYVEDLKTMMEFYSTLSISGTISTSALKLAMQRNVMELLHNHEALLEKLHSVASDAAARIWATNRVPARSERAPNVARKGVGANALSALHNTYHRVKNSVDDAELVKTQIMLGTADTTEVLDISDVFTEMMITFCAYEEYCVNHDTMSIELQRHLPCELSTYESGMEALSRSLMAHNRRPHHNKKGLTVADLLIKPIQRLCRYPLLFDDLLKQTPNVDCPHAHQSLKVVLDQLRNLTQSVNLANEDFSTREQVRRKWLLREKLLLHYTTLAQDQFRSLGNLQMCGVLYLTYQNADMEVLGTYGACILFDTHLLITAPTIKPLKLDPIALICLSDARIESAASNGGLQAHCSLHTWKMTFTSAFDVHEILLSACSKDEESRWKSGLQGEFRINDVFRLATYPDESKVFKDFRCINNMRCLQPFLDSSLPAQPVNTACSSSDVYQVVLRNTYNPQDLQEFRLSHPLSSDRSQHIVIKSTKMVVLTPKRAERTRLETALNDVYTKDRLPFPGMDGSKGSRILRASAGTLVRKLSFASMHASFSKRSASLSSKKSYHTVHALSRNAPTFLVRERDRVGHTPHRHGPPRELPELDTMDSVIGRMIRTIPATKPVPLAQHDDFSRPTAVVPVPRQQFTNEDLPEDPAEIIETLIGEEEEPLPEKAGPYKENEVGGVHLTDAKRKRWSNPILKLKSIGSDGIKNMFYASK